MSDSNDTHTMGGGTDDNLDKKRFPRKAIIWTGIVILVGFLVLRAFFHNRLHNWNGTSWNSLDDPTIQESKETRTFLIDAATNEDDLRVFDTLCPAIDAVVNEGTTNMSPTDEIRRSIMGGRWEGIDYDPSLSPLLWTRICELSERDMREKTGEDWEVIDFAYAFPLGIDPLMSDAIFHHHMPEPRNEESRILTTLVCTSGDHEGLVVQNDYLRWARTPHFENDYDEAVKRHDQMEDYLRTLRDILPDNEVLLLGGSTRIVPSGSRFSGYDLYIWENEDEEPLSDSKKFIEMARKIDESLTDVDMVATLAHGHPLSMSAEATGNSNSFRFSNEYRYPIPQGRSFASERDFGETQRICALDPRIHLDCRRKQDGIQLSIESWRLSDEDGDATDATDYLEGSRTGKPTFEEIPKDAFIY